MIRECVCHIYLQTDVRNIDGVTRNEPKLANLRDKTEHITNDMSNNI